MIEHVQINDVAPLVHYLADGVQAAFVFRFAVFKQADIEVWVDGAQVGSGYTVSGVGISTGGAVLFAVPPAAGARVTLRRRLALQRVSDFQTDGLIRAKTLNDELDYQLAAVQQVADDVSRCVKRPFTSTSTVDLTLPEPEAGKALGWNADGSGLVNDPADFAQVLAAAAQARSDCQASTGAQAATAADRTAVAADRAAVATARAAAAADAQAAAQDRATVAGLAPQVVAAQLDVAADRQSVASDRAAVAADVLTTAGHRSAASASAAAAAASAATASGAVTLAAGFAVQISAAPYGGQVVADRGDLAVAVVPFATEFAAFSLSLNASPLDYGSIR